MSCLKCGDTGILIGGAKCDCGAKTDIQPPMFLNIPAQYQNVRFDSRLVPSALSADYGIYLSSLLNECVSRPEMLRQNILICAPPNSGKTIFAYTALSAVYTSGRSVFTLRDILEIRELLMNPYRKGTDEVELLSEALIVFIKIPMDLPNKLAAIMSTVVERRVRSGGSTVFLYSGAKEDLIKQDTFGQLQALFGDGSYNSILVKSWRKKEGV